MRATTRDIRERGSGSASKISARRTKDAIPGAIERPRRVRDLGGKETAMEDEPTCGKGLAANSGLPAKLGELTAAVANVLEVHLKALDLRDSNARTEHEAYVKLAREHQNVATQLQALSTEMAGYQDLPMGRHDLQAMSAPEPMEALDRFVRVEEELLDLLQNRLEQDREMLLEMGRAQRGAS
jgi:hypothetical protein